MIWKIQSKEHTLRQHRCMQMCVSFSYSAHRYEPFYYSSQWSRFNLPVREPAAWLLLLFLINGIGLGFIGFSLVNSWLRMAERDCVGLRAIQYPRQFGSAVYARRRSSAQNPICLQSGMTPVFTGCGSTQQATVTQRRWQTRAGLGRTQSTGWSEAFQWWKGCSVWRTYSNGFSKDGEAYLR